MATPNWTPYNTIENSYNQMMNSPLQYNRPAESIRAPANQTNIYPDGRQNDPQNRIERMANKSFERWQAQNLFRDMQANTIRNDFNATAADLQNQWNNSTFGPNLYHATPGGAGSSNSPFQQFMNNQGSASLFGGSSPSSQMRYDAWNNQIFNRGNQANQALAPLYQRYGLTGPYSRPRSFF